MGKTIIILGKTCSGKTTFAKKMSELLGIKRLVTYTSRPPREGEEDKADYNFVTKEFFKNHEDDFVAKSAFEVEPYGMCYYGVKKSDLLNNENKILVIEPGGYYDILQKVGNENIFSIYIMTKNSDAAGRYIEREKDNPHAFNEVRKRLARDERDFHELEFHVDEIVVNKHYFVTLEKIHTTLLKELTKGDYDEQV